MWTIYPSHEAAKALLAFWRDQDADAQIVHDFTDDTWNTRFLGDLYQDLSEHAKKTTPCCRPRSSSRSSSSSTRLTRPSRSSAWNPSLPMATQASRAVSA